MVDVGMPFMGGLDVLRELSRLQLETKVILLSGYGSTDDVEEGFRLGAVDYLQKPVPIERLVETVARSAAHSLSLICRSSAARAYTGTDPPSRRPLRQALLSC